jgi:hypothetical protein
MGAPRAMLAAGLTGCAVLAVTVVVSVAMPDHHAATPPERQPVRAAHVDTKKKWIVVGAADRGLAPGDASAAAPTPPRSVPNGPGTSAVAANLRGILPTGSTQLSAAAYPDLHAASVTFQTPDHNNASLTVERLAHTVSLQSITMSPDSTGLSDLPSGSQLVQVQSLMPGVTTPAEAATQLRHIQVVVVRPSGVSMTFTIWSAVPGAALTFTDTPNPNRLIAAATTALDVRAADTLLK